MSDPRVTVIRSVESLEQESLLRAISGADEERPVGRDEEDWLRGLEDDRKEVEDFIRSEGEARDAFQVLEADRLVEESPMSETEKTRLRR